MFKQILSKIIKAGRTSVPNPLLYSRAVLYFLVFFTLSEIAYFVNQNDTSSVMTLVLIGLLTSFFNKNMVIILFTALVFTNILRFAMPQQDYILSEGFEDKHETAPTKHSSDKSSDKTSSDKTSSEKTLSEKTLSEKTSSAKKEDKGKEDASLSLKEDFDEFQSVQKKILESMNDLNPLLDKAEAFIQKYEQYKNVKDK
jgi:hypothetical protein